MIYPPVAPDLRTPRGFKDLVSASNGALGKIAWLLGYAGAICAAARGELGGRELLGRVARGLMADRGLGLGDVLYYTRLLEAYGLVDARLRRDPPKRVADLELRPTLMTRAVAEAVRDDEPCAVASLYAGLLFNTPARHLLVEAMRSRSLGELAASRELRGRSLFAAMLAVQLDFRLRRAEAAGRAPAAWYEPVTDATGVLLLAAALQVVVGKKATRRVVEPRTLNRLTGRLRLVHGYGDYVLPRMSLLEVMDYSLNGTSILEEAGLPPAAGRRPPEWLLGKVPKYVAETYLAVLRSLEERRGDIIEQFAEIYNS